MKRGLHKLTIGGHNVFPIYQYLSFFCKIIGMLLPGYGGYNLDACMPSQRHCLFDLLGSFARLHPWLSQRTSRAVKFVAIL